MGVKNAASVSICYFFTIDIKIVYDEFYVVRFLRKSACVEYSKSVSAAIEYVVISKMEFGGRPVFAVQHAVFFCEAVYGMAFWIEFRDAFICRYPKIFVIVFQNRVADVVKVRFVQC